MMRPDPLLTINRTSQMADNVKSGKLAFTLTALSIALVGMMAIKEFKDMIKSPVFDRDECSRRGRG